MVSFNKVMDASDSLADSMMGDGIKNLTKKLRYTQNKPVFLTKFSKFDHFRAICILGQIFMSIKQYHVIYMF